MHFILLKWLHKVVQQHHSYLTRSCQLVFELFIQQNISFKATGSEGLCSAVGTFPLCIDCIFVPWKSIVTNSRKKWKFFKLILRKFCITLPEGFEITVNQLQFTNGKAMEMWPILSAHSPLLSLHILIWLDPWNKATRDSMLPGKVTKFASLNLTRLGLQSS